MIYLIPWTSSKVLAPLVKFVSLHVAFHDCWNTIICDMIDVISDCAALFI